MGDRLEPSTIKTLVEAQHNMATKIQLRRDTATNWSGANPVLAQGEEIVFWYEKVNGQNFINLVN